MFTFTGQKSADTVSKQLKDLDKLLNNDLCPVFISWKPGGGLKARVDQRTISSLNVAGVMAATLVTCVDISTNESMSIKCLDQYSMTAKANTNREQ